MTKPKLRGSWGGKIEALGGLGVAKPNLRRASGSISGQSGGTPGKFGRVRGGQGASGGIQGGPLEKKTKIDFLKIGVPCAA